MKKLRIPLLCLLVVTMLSNCKVANTGNTPVAAAISCDSILSRLSRESYLFKPRIKNLDTRFKQFSIKLNMSKDVYQIRWDHIHGINEYELWMSDIKFECRVGSENCEYIGDEIVFTLDQVVLGNKCIQQGYSQSSNIFDCIYQKPWNVKVRARTCGYYGDFSDEIRNIYFQCADQ